MVLVARGQVRPLGRVIERRVPRGATVEHLLPQARREDLRGHVLELLWPAAVAGPLAFEAGLTQLLGGEVRGVNEAGAEVAPFAVAGGLVDLLFVEDHPEILWEFGGGGPG